MTVPASELRKLSNAYACSTKTLGRLLKRGIDVTDPEAVAVALAGQVNVSAPMLESVVVIAADRIAADIENTI